MIRCFVVGKGTIMRFGLWLDFMCPFGLRFWSTFLTIPLETFYSVGTHSHRLESFFGLLPFYYFILS